MIIYTVTISKPYQNFFIHNRYVSTTKITLKKQKDIDSQWQKEQSRQKNLI